MVTTVVRGVNGLARGTGSVNRGQQMRRQAELCGLIIRETLLAVAKAGNWPGKAQKVGSEDRLHW